MYFLCLFIRTLLDPRHILNIKNDQITPPFYRKMAAMEILYLSSTYKLIYVFKIREIYKQICMFIVAMISDVEYREFQNRLF